jgi:hypothetical protein
MTLGNQLKSDHVLDATLRDRLRAFREDQAQQLAAAYSHAAAYPAAAVAPHPFGSAAHHHPVPDNL